MRLRYVFAVALLVMLAGCGGLAADPGENTTSPDVENDSGVGETDDSEPTPDPQPNLEILSISMESEVVYNQSGSGRVTISNIGDAAGNATLRVSFENETLTRRQVTLEANESETVEFNTSRLRLEQGHYRVRVDLDDQFDYQRVNVDHPSPYGSTEIDLYVNDSAANRDLNESISRATAYWEKHDTEYFGYEAEYNVVNNEFNADKALTFERVDKCGENVHSEYLGCADIIKSDVDEQVQLSVDPRPSNPYITSFLIHELGHTHGLEHGDEPTVLMAERYDEFESDEPVTFHVRSLTGSLPDSVKEEIEEALRFYQSEGAFEYKFVDSTADAHHVITYDSRGTKCGYADGGSCAIEGEYKSQVNIRIEQLDSQVVAFHVAYHLAGPAVDRLPEGLDTEDRDERERWPR